jgi:hypothetical protein
LRKLAEAILTRARTHTLQRCTMASVTADATPPPIELVCLHALAGDTTSLCAAACVSREWHAAVTRAAPAWRVLTPSAKARAEMTDARLAALAARACSNLESMDARGARSLTNAGLLAALAPQTKLARVLLAGCEALSVCGVQADADAQQAAVQLARIQALLPDAQTLDVSGACAMLKECGGEECARLGGPPGERCFADDIELRRLEEQGTLFCDVCQVCDPCALCAAELKQCGDCGRSACAHCADDDLIQQCAHCRMVTCHDCMGGFLGDGGMTHCDAYRDGKPCPAMYCVACTKLDNPAVVLQCGRCQDVWYCATPCVRAADMQLVCDGCPDDSDGEEMVMMCADCRNEEDEEML